MTERIREFLRNRRDGRAVPRRRPRRRARQLPDLRQGAAGHARVLRREGQPGAGGAGAAGRARLLLRHRLGRRDRDGARGRRRRRTASPTATRSRRSATSRAPTRSACASSRSTARPRSRRSPAPRPARSVFCRILCDGAGAEWPLSRKFGCEPDMAVGRARARPPARPRGLRRLVPRRLAAAQPARLGPRARLGGRRSSASAASAACSSVDGQSRRRLPDQVPEERADGEEPTARRSSARCASISATASRRPSSSRAAAWSAMPA